MESLYLIYIIGLGLIFGSFLSVIVFRLDQKSGIFMGRSECPKCLTQLKWYDLFPLFSFLYLGGKCRACKVKIAVIYPIMELAVAASFGSYCFLNGPCIASVNLYQLIIIFILLTLLFYDYIYFILPDKLIIIGSVISLLYISIFTPGMLKSGLITGLALGSFFAILYIASGGKWLGFGDAKLAFLIGLVMGFPLGLWAILISIWAGAIWGGLLMLFNKANLKTPLPFGSFMAGVTIILIIIQKYEISQYFQI